MRLGKRALAVGTLIAGVTAIAGSAVGPASAEPAATGTVILVGGNLREDAEILQRIVDEARDAAGGETPRIAVVTAAAATAKNPAKARSDRYNNAAANGIYYSNLFQAFGAETYAVPIDTRVDWKKDPYVPANAWSDDVAAEVRSSDAVFFGGGDQMRYVRTLFECDPAPDEAFESCEDTPVMAAIRDVVAAGGVVAGLSAGTTIMQGPDMVTGGESYEAWRDGSAPGYFDDATKLAYLPYGGFGFFPEGLVDSHFGTWGRQARMIRLAADTGHELVVGVDETTALVYDRSTRTAEVIGRNGVSLIEVPAAAVDGEVADGVSWTYLAGGDSVDFATGTVTPATASTTDRGTGDGPAPEADVWDSIAAADPGVYSLVDLALALVASSADTATGTTLEADPRYTTTLTRTGATAWWDGGFRGLAIQIAPIAG